MKEIFFNGEFSSNATIKWTVFEQVPCFTSLQYNAIMVLSINSSRGTDKKNIEKSRLHGELNHYIINSNILLTSVTHKKRHIVNKAVIWRSMRSNVENVYLF